MHRLEAGVRLAVVVVDDEIGDVVDVVVADEELVGLVVRHRHVVERRVRSSAGVEDEDLVVGELDHEAGCSLAAARRIAGAESDDAHLIGGERLRSRVINVRIVLQRRPLVLDYDAAVRQGLGAKRLG